MPLSIQVKDVTEKLNLIATFGIFTESRDYRACNTVAMRGLPTRSCKRIVAHKKLILNGS